MNKVKIISIIVAIVILAALVFVGYKAYQFKKMVDTHQQVLMYLFTPDEQKVNGFTKETYGAIQIINNIQTATSTQQ